MDVLRHAALMWSFALLSAIAGICALNFGVETQGVHLAEGEGEEAGVVDKSADYQKVPTADHEE